MSKFLTGSKGDTEEFFFESNYYNYDDKQFEKVSKFTPHRSVNIILKNDF